MNTIACIPADQEGNKLWVKDFKVNSEGATVVYKTTYNDMPWQETPIYVTEDGKGVVITGDDGTVLYTFSVSWLEMIK